MLQYTVNAALDASSQQLWQVNFGQSLFYTGDWYPVGYEEQYYGQMVVYGDGSMYIGYGPRQISASSADPAKGTVYLTHADGWYNYGTTVYLWASPNYGYCLDHWVIDGQPVYTQNPSVTMNQAHTAVAYFTPAPPVCTIYYEVFINECWMYADSYQVAGDTYQDIVPPNEGTLYLWFIDSQYQGNLDDVWCPTYGSHSVTWFFTY